MCAHLVDFLFVLLSLLCSRVGFVRECVCVYVCTCECVANAKASQRRRQMSRLESAGHGLAKITAPANVTDSAPRKLSEARRPARGGREGLEDRHLEGTGLREAGAGAWKAVESLGARSREGSRSWSNNLRLGQMFPQHSCLKLLFVETCPKRFGLFWDYCPKRVV